MAKETVKSARVVRKPLFKRGPQTVIGEKDPNYEYRFVNDTGSRVHVMQQAGYEFVTEGDLSVGDNRISDASDLGSNKKVISNDGTVSYLMRIKKEWYKEDQAAKAALIDEQEAAMKQQASQGFTGSVKLSRD